MRGDNVYADMRKECIVWATKGFYGIFHSFNSVINASSVLTHLSAIRWILKNEWLIRNKQENLEKIQNLPKHRKNNGPNGFLKFKNSKYENLFTNSSKTEKNSNFQSFSVQFWSFTFTKRVFPPHNWVSSKLFHPFMLKHFHVCLFLYCHLYTLFLLRGMTSLYINLSHGLVILAMRWCWNSKFSSSQIRIIHKSKINLLILCWHFHFFMPASTKIFVFILAMPFHSIHNKAGKEKVERRGWVEENEKENSAIFISCVSHMSK